MRATPESTSTAATDKAQRYDRQLRLWQETGQQALETARVSVFGSSALAAESLKNLILPGIGEFVVIDDATVGEQDVLTNFFVAPADLGKPRAEAIVEQLTELNPDVRGSAVVKSAESALETDILESATLVIACGLPAHTVQRISRLCWERNIALVVADTAGFAARLRTAIPEHAVVESHEELAPDLRIQAPFPGLAEHSDSIDLDTLDHVDLAHVPYVVLVLKALRSWATANGREVRRDTAITYAEKRKIKEEILCMAPNMDEENFREAHDKVNGDVIPYQIPAEVRRILSDPAAQNITAKSEKFWIMAHALRAYMASPYADGQLPLSGTIPDMKADTKSYIALQRVYKQKADADKAEYARHVRESLASLDLPPDFISQGEIDAYCKDARRLRLLRFTPLHDELESGPKDASALVSAGALDQYVAFRASDVFFAKHKRHPGVADSSTQGDGNDVVNNDTAELVAIANELLVQWSIESEVAEDVVRELARSGHAELHNIASLAGGIVSQEAIKLVTHQYVPANNGCIIDGASARIIFVAV
ncbi:putative NEDD8-activating enzyme E1 regulatory subunit [Linderina pennispora]|uniref:NEDD8-activating enzyme E1 regulatory subunit n=1 Tax=Linderina pennispora TaxID=61395 RepID=A0A1Y1W1M2_9FUNG|nr:putative NEDD8-activating enzyme E1 regulatory subunit [Linderina pennispora]ORX67410.1 putative NEDD8-activating enzyme E1 regulatory subunit [Linderina pennispora]